MAFEAESMEALKWAAVIFIAGFIGYFGKYLSKLVIARIHRKGGPEDGKKAASPPKTKEEMDYKLEKKRLKIEKKRLKTKK